MDINPNLTIKEVTPRFYAQQCPVCNGFGTLRHGTKRCQGCDGKGYIFVPTGTDGGKYGQDSQT